MKFRTKRKANEMNTAKKILMASLMAGVIALMTGCSTTCHKAGAATCADDQAMMCGKCQAVWVSRPQQINKVTVYRKVKTMSCPDCDSAAANFFKTGKFEHTCKICVATA